MSEVTEQGEPRETIRVALVMNGGVSLAVWMGGVTHELHRLLEASRKPDGDPSPWAGVLQGPPASPGPPIRHKVVVDYAAGTSAGGMNGAILATSLARGVALPSLKELWLDKGRLQRGALLPPEEAPGLSLLDGDFFHSVIEDVVDRIPINSQFAQKMTLLVTATAMAGGEMRVEDANDHRIDVSDHRRVYKFESQKGEVGTFADSATLARAARASASFPVAFTPVRETEELARRRSDGATTIGMEGTWLIDGGVLDNAPFEPLMEEIVQHPRADAGRRLVVYVVPYAPSGSERDPGAAADDGEAPPWLSVLRTLGSLRGEADLRSDIAALRGHLASAREVVHPPEVLIAGDLPLTAEEVARLLPMYARTRAAGFIRYLREQYTRVEKIGGGRIDQGSLDQVLGAAPYFLPTSLEPTGSNERWQWGVVVARRMVLWMSRQARGNAPVDVLARLAAIELELAAVNERIDAEYALDRYRNQQPTYVLHESMARINAEITPIAGLMNEAVAVWAGTAGFTAADAWQRLAKVEVVTNFDEWQQRPTAPTFDTILVDTAEGSVRKFVLAEEPSLADSIQKQPNDKLYGTRLHHFGSFGHESYRGHDWTWGRVDGALCLASALTKGMDGAHRDAVRNALVDGILAEEGLTREQFAARTLKVHGISDTALALDIIRRGEADVMGLLASVERAVSVAIPAGGPLAWVRRITGLDGGKGLLEPVVGAVQNLADWLQDRARDARAILDGKD